MKQIFTFKLKFTTTQKEEGWGQGSIIMSCLVFSLSLEITNNGGMGEGD